MNSTFKRGALAISGLVLTVFAVSKLSQNVMTARAATPCVITISGVQYDVAPLLVPGVHPGGTSMFVCGTDLTSTFMSMPTHAADIARMAPYIYAAPSATPTPTPSPSAIPSPTPSPSVTPSPTPSATPSPSVTPSPTATPGEHENEHEDENENEQAEAHEREHENHNQSGEHRQDGEHRNVRSLKQD